MRVTRRRAVWAALAVAGFSAIGLASAGTSTARSTDKPIADNTPAVVAQGKAQNRGRHNGNELFTLNVGLAVRDSSGLDALIKAASSPGSPQYGHYLTNAQYMASYAPT